MEYELRDQAPRVRCYCCGSPDIASLCHHCVRPMCDEHSTRAVDDARRPVSRELAGLELEEVFVLAPTVSFAVDRPASLLERAERRWRVQVTRRCLREVEKLHRLGTEVTVLGPGPEDLVAMGSNLMAAQRRREVLETSLRTSVAALVDPEPLTQPSPEESAGQPGPAGPRHYPEAG